MRAVEPGQRRAGVRARTRALAVGFALFVPAACSAVWGFDEGVVGTTLGSGGEAAGGTGAGAGGATAGAGPSGGSGGESVPALCPNGWSEFDVVAAFSVLNSSDSDIDPSVSSDELALYFASNRVPDGGIDRSYEIYVATRETTALAFTGFSLVSELSSDLSDWSPDISPDGLAIYFSSARAGGLGSYDIWVATRSAPGSPFGGPELVAAVNQAGEEIDPAVSADGRTLYFSTDQGAGGERAIWRATRPSAQADFESPMPVDEVASADPQFDPAISADGRELFFTRHASDTGRDLWVARRQGASGTFVTVAALGNGINTAEDEFAPALSADGSTLYFASNRESGNWDLWRATRSCPR